MKKSKFGLVLLCLLVVFALVFGATACKDPTPDTPPGGEEPDPDPAPGVEVTVTGVTVSPASVSVVKGTTQQFTASVSGTGSPAQTVTWSIVETGKNAGTVISESGLLTVAAAETLTTLTIQATSTVDNTKSGTATVNVTSAAATVTSVTVYPAEVSVAKGTTHQFTATVIGTNDPAQTVTWSIDETAKDTGTSIVNGLLTVAAAETLSTLTVRATSAVDTSKSGTADVTVVIYALGGTLTISPLTGYIGRELTATYNGTETDVTISWYKEGEADAVETGSSPLTFTPSSSGVYYAKANKTGYATVTSDTITVTTYPPLEGTITINAESGFFVNEELTASYDGEESNVSYTWYKVGSSHILSTEETFTPTEEGNYFVRVTKENYSYIDSDPFIVSMRSLTGTINIEGIYLINEELEASYDGPETIDRFEWVRKGFPAVATGDTYTPSNAGAYIITAIASGYLPLTLEFMVTNPSNYSFNGEVIITPNTGVTTGVELFASYNGSETVLIAYNWYRDSIHVHSGQIYTPNVAGTYTVTITSTGYNPKTGAPVTVTLPALTGTVSITGNPQAGNTLTANVSALNGSGIIYYEWSNEAGTILSSVSTYTSTEADVGKIITLTVSWSGNNGERKASILIQPLPVVTGEVTGTVTVSDGIADVTVSFEQAGDSPLILQQSGSITVTVTGSYGNYLWTIDNSLYGSGAALNSIVLDGSNYEIGETYRILVIVSSGGIPYSAQIYFTVE